jgi:hypothetical protein
MWRSRRRWIADREESLMFAPNESAPRPLLEAYRGEPRTCRTRKPGCRGGRTKKTRSVQTWTRVTPARVLVVGQPKSAFAEAPHIYPQKQSPLLKGHSRVSLTEIHSA